MSQIVSPRSNSLFRQIRSFLEMIRFSHTLFALPFAIAGAVLAWRAIERTNPGLILMDLLGILVCMVFARTTAMAFNRIVDRKIDSSNPRTAMRHLPSGKLSVKAVVIFALLSGIAFIISTIHFWVWNQNLWPLILSVPTLLLICGYSFAKRFTSLSHVWLGIALAFSPIAAWIAITGTVSPVAIALGCAVMFWVAGFDILYATQDTEFDRQAGLHSIPAKFGIRIALRIAMVLHVGMVACLVSLWWLAGLGMVFLVGVCLVALLLVYEHSLVKPDDLGKVNSAFFNVNVVISLGLLLVILLDLIFI